MARAFEMLVEIGDVLKIFSFLTKKEKLVRAAEMSGKLTTWVAR